MKLTIVVPGGLPHEVSTNKKNPSRWNTHLATGELRQSAWRAARHAMSRAEWTAVPAVVSLTHIVCNKRPRTGSVGTLQYKSRYRPRDPFNFASSCKAVLDGVVDAGALLGDEWQHLVVGRVDREIVEDFNDEAIRVELEPVVERVLVVDRLGHRTWHEDISREDRLNLPAG